MLSLFTMPTQPQAGYFIAFSSIDANRNEDIYVIRDDGTQLTQVTNSPSRDWHPDWSLDGTRLVYASDREQNAEIYLHDLNTGEITNLTQTPNSDELAPDWSPTGQTVVFTSNRDGGFDLYVLNLATLAVERLTTDGVEKTAPTWFPDGQQVAYWAQKDDAPVIYTVSRQTGNRSLLVSQPNTSWPDVSSDGRQLLYEVLLDGRKQIYLQDLVNNSDAVPLTSGTSNNAQPAWSADGRRIAFVSDRNSSAADSGSLYLMQSDGSAITPLTHCARPVMAASRRPISDCSGNHSDTYIKTSIKHSG